MEKIAIIPARSGSKRLKDKNIRELNGKPLIAYTIEAAIEAEVFSKIHVSTDSRLYAEIAVKYGADVPFLRSKKNSIDSASSWDVAREVLIKYKEMGYQFDECMLLQPTSPLRDSNDIKEAYKVYINHNADSFVSVCEVDHPVQWCFELDNSRSMHQFSKSPYKNMRRQQLSKYYRENGAIYHVKTDKLFEPEFDFYSGNCYAYLMERGKSIDIDTEIDFRIAEVVMYY